MISTTPYKIKIVKKIDDALIEQWNALQKRAYNGNIYNSYSWFNAYMHVRDNRPYEIYTCYQGEKLVALLPLEKYICYGIPVWGTFCPERLGNTAFLMESYDEDIFRFFFGAIFKKWNVYIQKMDKEAAELLHKCFPKALMPLMSVNPIILLKDDPMAKTSGSLRAQIKSILKKNDGKLDYKYYDTDLEKHFAEMIELQKESSKAARSMDIFEDKKTKAYYESLVKYCNEMVSICFLYYEGKPIVYQYGLGYKDYYVGEQISYHKDYKKISPGKLMIYFLITSLKKNKISCLDQGGGISYYKQSFSTEYRTFYNMYYSNNPLVMLLWRSINKARRIKQVRYPKPYTRDHEFLFRTFKSSFL